MSAPRTWEQEAALWRLIQAFFLSAAKERGLGACRGFSRQAMGDIAAAFAGPGVHKVCRLRQVVRELVDEAARGSQAPLKITSATVRPYLERHLGQTRADRDAYVLTWINRHFEASGWPALRAPEADYGVAA